MLQLSPVLWSYSILFSISANIATNSIFYMNLSHGSSPCWEGEWLAARRKVRLWFLAIIGTGAGPAAGPVFISREDLLLLANTCNTNLLVYWHVWLSSGRGKWPFRVIRFEICQDYWLLPYCPYKLLNS